MKKPAIRVPGPEKTLSATTAPHEHHETLYPRIARTTPIVCEEFYGGAIHARRDWDARYYVAGVTTTPLCGATAVYRDQPTIELTAVTCKACKKALAAFMQTRARLLEETPVLPEPPKASRPARGFH